MLKRNKLPFLFSVVAVLVSACAGSGIKPSGPEGDGRVLMYTYNSKQQLIRQRWVDDSHIAGCHGLGREREVFRFSQIGYNYCQIFSSPDCRAGTELPAYWDGSDYRVEPIDVNQAQLKLYRGNRWILSKENKNVAIASWSCTY